MNEITIKKEDTKIATKAEPITNFLHSEQVQNKIQEMLKDPIKVRQFITSIVSLVSGNVENFKDVDKHTILTACLQAVSLDLPINSNLGFAHIIPYGGKAQFQMGYKGFIQLALRSGQFKVISDALVYEGQLIEENPLTGYKFDWSKKGKKVIGYVAYFETINGFSKTLYMTVEELEKHALTYSQTYRKGFGKWKDNFDAMARKTVIKLLLSKYAPLSTEMQKALIIDQGIINDYEGENITYIDNMSETISIDEIEELFALKKESIPTDKLKDIERIISTKEEKSYFKLKSYLKTL